MLIFKVILLKFRDRLLAPWKYALPFLPPVILYLAILRPALKNSTLFAGFVWLADCLFFGIPIGICIGAAIGKKVGRAWGDAIFYPLSYLKSPPDMLSPIRGMLARAEYEPAIAELNAMLAEKPFSPEPYLLLTETWAGELHDYRRALELTEAYFNREKIESCDENIDLLLLYADLCEEHGGLEQARLLLEREIARKGYPEIKRQCLQSRLETINSKLNPANAGR